MFRTHQFISASLAIVSLGYTGAAAMAGEVVEVRNLQPFTHIAYIPASADLSSIKVEGIKAVKVITKQSSVMNAQSCENGWAEPGGSMYCPHRYYQAPVSAYEVRYSFKGQPMASDEYGNTYFTFSVYFRPDELSPALRRAPFSGRISRRAAAEFFQFTTSRDSNQEIVIDGANSAFCAGNYVDGNWTLTNRNCKSRVAYKAVDGASPYITVKVEPVPASVQIVISRNEPPRN